MMKRTCQVNVTLRGTEKEFRSDDDSNCEHIEMYYLYSI